jgi:hypothetical protein
MIQEKSSHQIWKSPMKTRTTKMRTRTMMRKVEMQETQHQRATEKAKPLSPLLRPDQRERPQHPRKDQLPRDVSFLSPMHFDRADEIGPTVNVEYEQETEPLSREMLKNW